MDKKNTCGILVAADQNSEWLLPWWWERLTAHTRLPLAFVDLGMSHGARFFCEERGEVILLNHPKVPANLDGRHKGWFKKPFAFEKTPFEKTLWLDCDCEVIRPLESLFGLEGEIFLATDTENAHKKERELGTILDDEILYNSGVILYEKGSPLIQKWMELTASEGDRFFSDQHLLSRIIYTENYPVKKLHENYNWRMSQGLNIHAVIVHWAGTWGKEYIRKHGGIGHQLATLPQI